MKTTVKRTGQEHRMNSKEPGTLLQRSIVAFVILLLSACGNESQQAEDKNAYLSFSIGVRAQALDTLSSLIISVINRDTGATIASGNILPSGNLTLTVPPRVDMVMDARGFEGGVMTYRIQNPAPEITALLPGEVRTGISFRLDPYTPPGTPGTPVVTPPDQATDVSVLADITVDASVLALINTLDSVSLVLTPDGASPISMVYVPPESGFLLSFALPNDAILQTNTQYSARLALSYTNNYGETADINLVWSFATGQLVDYNGISDAQLRACVEANLSTESTVFDLVNLDCSGQTISSLTGLEQFSNLQFLNMADANLTDLSPIRNLTGLTTLELYNCGECNGGNQFSDLTPLAQLTNLTYLDLTQVGAQDLSGLENLVGLNALGLSGNNIMDLTPLANLMALEYLYLNSNQISDISPLSNLVSLLELYVSGNQVIDVTTLGSLLALTSLSLASNQISDISALGNLTSLTWLSMGSNRIVDISSLAGLTNLQLLGLTSNRVVDISAINSMPALLTLNASYNSVESVALSGHANLQNLYLDRNRIKTINISGDMPALQSFYAYYNYITDVVITGALPSLTNASFGGNNISDVAAFGGLTGLTTLGLANNIIEDVTPLANLTSLNSLILSNNNIHTGVSNLAGLPAAAFIYLEGNSPLACDTLTAMDAARDSGDGPALGRVRWNRCFGEALVANLVFPDTVSGAALSTCVTNLSVANVADVTSLTCAGVTNLSGIEQLPFLTVLDLSGNAIENFSPLSSLTNLEELNLNSTGFNHIGAIGNLKKVRVLDLGSNPISFVARTAGIFPEADLENLLALTNVYLTGSQLFNGSGIRHLNTLVNAQIDFSCMDAGTVTDLTLLDNALDGGDGGSSGNIVWECM
ncbi:MAG: leucine-rich repeat domain-containing protein [Gammaproteobacteria bacterium]|nr:leucine-rich repeat domain-containing protein [Gammaproteobacteria bacterium]MDH5802554.1 leucine-rich repeat domain-containing protein [Gammaproteobacteria bacterium]